MFSNSCMLSQSHTETLHFLICINLFLAIIFNSLFYVFVRFALPKQIYQYKFAHNFFIAEASLVIEFQFKAPDVSFASKSLIKSRENAKKKWLILAFYLIFINHQFFLHIHNYSPFKIYAASSHPFI
jgi:hypothetical protein